MGTTSTKPVLTIEQQDIKYLASKYPFGDDELWKLYRAVHELRNATDRISFVTDWANQCTRLKPEETTTDDASEKPQQLREEKTMLMQVVENKILPDGFSERLSKVFTLDEIGAGTCPSTELETDEIRMARAEEARRSRLDRFFEGASNVGRRGGRKALGIMFDCCASKQEKKPKANEPFSAKAYVVEARELLDMGHRLALASTFLEAASKGEEMGKWIHPENDSKVAIESLSRSLVDFIKGKRMRQGLFGTDLEDEALSSGLVEKVDLQEWSDTNAPLLPASLSTFMHHVFFPEKSYPSSRTPFDYPKLDNGSIFFSKPTSPLLFGFACLSRSLGGTWHRLYTSASDGLSFNRLQNALLGYAGPTLLIIQATNGGIFGAFTASAWKESKDFYGNSDCFLYQLVPMTEIYRPSGNGTNYMYCNSFARSRGYDQQAHGIGFGGSVEQPRLYIAESFDGCLATSRDLTFENGTLLPKTKDGALQKSFDIDCLEVWGVGGEVVVTAALGARDRQREIQAANIQKARKVDKAAFLDDFRSGLIQSKAFKYRSEIQGRADEAVDERNRNAQV